MTEQRRINIAPLAHHFAAQGYDKPEGNAPENSFDFSVWYQKTKPELYALTAIVADRSVSRAVALRPQRPPYGLTTISNIPPQLPILDNVLNNYRSVVPSDIDHQYPFFSIADFMRDTLFRGITEEAISLKVGAGGHEKYTVWERLENILSAVNQFAPEGNRASMGSTGFIASGINFASVVMTGMLDVISDVAPREYQTAEGLTQIAINSYPLVVKLAAGEFDKVTGAVNYMSNAYPGNHLKFDPTNFKISEDEKRHPMLEISPKGKFILMANDVDLEEPADHAVLGCPALVNFGEGSAIRKMWDWNIDIAQQIYPGIVANKNK